MWLTTSTGSVSKLLREAGPRWLVVSQAACIRALSRPTQWTTRSGAGRTGRRKSWSDVGTRRADSRVQLARRSADMKGRADGEGGRHSHVTGWPWQISYTASRENATSRGSDRYAEQLRALAVIRPCPGWLLLRRLAASRDAWQCCASSAGRCCSRRRRWVWTDWRAAGHGQQGPKYSVGRGWGERSQCAVDKTRQDNTPSVGASGYCE
jgi:hypothetical protein